MVKNLNELKKGNKMKKTLCLLFAFIGFYAFADDNKGFEIAKEVKLRDTGWNDTEANMEMILINATGKSTSRKIRVKTLEMENQGDKSITVFDLPKSIKGTVFLSHSHIDKADDQWIYIPALKITRRIASRYKSEPLMGSEFAFEDMISFELEKFEFEYITEDETHYIIKQIPIDEFTGYSEQKVWVEKERYIVTKIEFYDRKEALLKTLKLDEYKLYQDKFWRAHKSQMVNSQTRKETVLILENIKFGVGLKESNFNTNAIKRIK